MKKQILVLSIALGAFTLTAQTTPSDKKKDTQQKGTQKGNDHGTIDQTEPTKNKNQQKGNQSTEQKGMRQSGSEDMNSGSTEKITPPSSVSDKFSKENPNINATWHTDGNNYSAEYMDHSTNLGKNVVYDHNGNVIRTDSEMSTDGLNYPSSIGDYHSKNFPNEGYRVWQTDDGKGNTWFYTKRKNGTVWFDKDGKYYPGKQGKMEDKPKTK